MAERPVFLPRHSGSSPWEEISVEFEWIPGMSRQQRFKSLLSLHRAAETRGMAPLLDVSTISNHESGRRLSAFSIKVQNGEVKTVLECAFQGSKVFEHGGPYIDLYEVSPREAKSDPRLRDSGPLVGFSWAGDNYPVTPPTAFYDWLYFRCLTPHRAYLRKMCAIRGFTDIAFNPAKSLNCQARACAIAVGLEMRGLVEQASASFGDFVATVYAEGANRAPPGIPTDAEGLAYPVQHASQG